MSGARCRVLDRASARSVACALLAVSLSAATPPALDLIQAKSLEGDLSFLSSDLLEGRATPSRGLDIAAEYIASEFRRAGLEPGGDNSYFQSAHLEEVKPVASDIALSLNLAGADIAVPPADVHARAAKGVDLHRAPAVRIDVFHPPAPATLAGKVALIDIPYGTRRQDIMHAYFQLRQSPALAIVLVEHGRALIMPTHSQLVNPGALAPALVETRGEAFAKAVSALAASAHAAITLHIPAPDSTPVSTQNVIGVLRGSDPGLAKTCIVLSAHYDHLGMKTEGEGDRIYNGANDDGSGVVSVIEIAAALATMNPRPKRTIVFVTFFGEELGLVGSALLCPASAAMPTRRYRCRRESGTGRPHRFFRRPRTRQCHHHRLRLHQHCRYVRARRPGDGHPGL